MEELSFVTGDEVAHLEALAALDIPPDETTHAAAARVQDRQAMLARTREARDAADARAQAATATLQALIEARLRGRPDLREDEVRRQAAEASIELDSLVGVPGVTSRKFTVRELAKIQSV